MTKPSPAEQLLETASRMSALGLNKGTSGNASIRLDDGLLLTPSGIPADQLSVNSMVYMQWDGTPEAGKKTYQ